jgi:hypothetical protein
MIIIKLLPARESLVSDIPAGDGKNDNLFYSVAVPATQREKKDQVTGVYGSCGDSWGKGVGEKQDDTEKNLVSLYVLLLQILLFILPSYSKRIAPLVELENIAKASHTVNNSQEITS